jgi:hypothetical protein
VPELVAGGSRTGVGTRLGSLWGFVRSGVQNASATPFNGPIGPHRRVEWLGFDLAEMKEIKKRIGGTLNDVVLAAVAGAARRFLEDRNVNVDVLDFRVMAPVSVRTANERGTLGNRVSAWILDLHRFLGGLATGTPVNRAQEWIDRDYQMQKEQADQRADFQQM